MFLSDHDDRRGQRAQHDRRPADRYPDDPAVILLIRRIGRFFGRSRIGRVGGIGRLLFLRRDRDVNFEKAVQILRLSRDLSGKLKGIPSLDVLCIIEALPLARERQLRAVFADQRDRRRELRKDRALFRTRLYGDIALVILLSIEVIEIPA